MQLVQTTARIAVAVAAAAVAGALSSRSLKASVVKIFGWPGVKCRSKSLFERVIKPLTPFGRCQKQRGRLTWTDRNRMMMQFHPRQTVLMLPYTRGTWLKNVEGNQGLSISS